MIDEFAEKWNLKGTQSVEIKLQLN